MKNIIVGLQVKLWNRKITILDSPKSNEHETY